MGRVFAVEAVDAHMLGQHGRVLFGGLGRLAPRGYLLSSCNIVLPPCDPRAGAAFAAPRRTRVMTDREAIVEVLAAYGRLLNEMRLAELAALFMPDGQVSYGPIEQLEARDRAVLE